MFLFSIIVIFLIIIINKKKSVYPYWIFISHVGYLFFLFLDFYLLLLSSTDNLKGKYSISEI